MQLLRSSGRMVSALAIAVSAACLIGVPGSSLAQEAGQAAPGAQPQGALPGDPGWIKLCSENPETKENVCVITREKRAATGQMLAALSIRESSEKKFLVAAVPPAMLIRPGLQVQVDGSESTKVAYTICFPNLCFAEAEINADFILGMKRGNNLVVTTLNQQAKPVNFDISLSGFTASYDGDAIDPKELQAKQEQLQSTLQQKAEETRKKLIEMQQRQTNQ